MPAVTATLDLAHPPAAVFAVVADPHQRRRLFPDNFRDVQVLALHEDGPGTRIRFTIVTATGEHTSEVEVAEWDPPHALTERTLGPDGYTLHWRFQPLAGGTRATATTEYQIQGNILHRLVDRWFARKALQQSLLVELLRLQEVLDGERAADDTPA
jgi:uncharacterized protein YndB with AHSA1/START domain